MAQDDYYYEIQLTNKQLVFYFMAGATGLILSFLAGVMVGRGVDSAQGDVQARNVTEEKVVAEEPAVRATPSPDLTYAQRLESDKVDSSLERPKAAAEAPAAPASKAAASTAPPATQGAASLPPPTVPAPRRTTPDKPASDKPAPEKAPPAAEKGGAESPAAKAVPAAKTPAKPAPAKPVAEAAKGEPSFTIQVGAFKDRATADSVVARLKGKGFAAYILSPDGSDPGLFVVRVGHYAARADAEHAEGKLRDQEKFKPYIIKQ
jgi:septal ring-binding cell division protein DamX